MPSIYTLIVRVETDDERHLFDVGQTCQALLDRGLDHNAIVTVTPIRVADRPPIGNGLRQEATA